MEVPPRFDLSRIFCLYQWAIDNFIGLTSLYVGSQGISISMVRLFLASIPVTKLSNAIRLNMKAKGTRESEMVLLELPENQDKRPPPLNHPLHEVRL